MWAAVLLASAVFAAAGGAAHGTVTRLRTVPVAWLAMVDGMHGFALSRGSVVFRVLRTDDGGALWRDITPPTGEVQWGGLSADRQGRVLVSVTVGAHLFAVWRSDDGGRHWRRSLPFSDRGRNVSGQAAGAARMLDNRHGYLAVDEGAAAGSQAEALFATADGARSWRFVSRTGLPAAAVRRGSLPFSCDKTGFGFTTPMRGWAGGFCPGGPPFFYRTLDGGLTWQLQALPGVAHCQCEVSPPRFFTPRAGTLDVGGFDQRGAPLVRVYWTNNGGSSWRGSDVRAGRPLGSASLPDANTAWLLTTRGGRADRLARTTDAGRHWQTRTLPFSGLQLDALNATTAYAFDPAIDRTTIRLTRDGGAHWLTTHTNEASG